MMGIHYQRREEPPVVVLIQEERREQWPLEAFEANADAICAAFFRDGEDQNPL
jgi:hypothetical protein